MTVQATTSRADYNGNGATVAFTVPFYFLDNAHIQVLRTQISTNTTTTLALTTNYTVTGAGVGAGGTVTCLVAPTTDQRISILRNVPLTQLAHYVPNDPFPAATHEQVLDQLTMEVQQVNETLSRAIKLSATNTITSPEFSTDAATRANKVLSFDANGDLSVAQSIGTYRANWAASVSYTPRDIVKDTSNGNIYICLTIHTSSGVVPISSNADSAKWALLVDAATATAAQAAAAASASAASTSASSASTSASTATTQASAASSSASAASSSATAASGSAVSAAASAASINVNTLVGKTSATGGAVMPAGTTAQRDVSPVAGYLRYNSSTGAFEGYGSAWGSIGGGATGAGGDAVFQENAMIVTTSYTLTTAKSASSVGPITINGGVVVTVPSGARWVIL